jgi:hypothetical protein
MGFLSRKLAEQQAVPPNAVKQIAGYLCTSIDAFIS